MHEQSERELLNKGIKIDFKKIKENKSGNEIINGFFIIRYGTNKNMIYNF